MEDLLQQECLVESQIETYESQLSLVEQQLEASGDGADMPDLRQLRSDLSELIALTKESLLEIKKQRLLLSLQSPSAATKSSATGAAPQTGAEAITGDCRGGGQEQEKEEGEGEEEEEDDLRGSSCQAPLEEAWGAVNYHNAIIIGKESKQQEEKEEEEDTKVTVLFIHPTYNAMRPCPYFLDGTCKFGDHACKFSHGHTVSLSELRPFQEPDFSLAHVGGKCLAKHSDGLWHPALISSVGETFTVHFTTLNATVQVEPDSILPLDSSESSSSASSDDGDDEEEEVEEDMAKAVIEWTSSGPQQALGEWEKHTTGIGSRLLAKMGYVVGKGLGKREQGRVNPVEITILPAGRSLDVCAEMREAGKLRKPIGQDAGKKKRRKRGKGRGRAADAQEHPHQQQGEERDIFDFLNQKLLRKDSRVGNSSGGVSLRKSGGGKTGNSTGKEESLNVKLFKVQEEMKTLKKRRDSLRQTVLRHRGRRDKAMEARTQEKLAATEKELSQLQRHEQSIEKSITSKSERRKLSVF